jgi:hypothetical protein
MVALEEEEERVNSGLAGRARSGAGEGRQEREARRRDERWKATVYLHIMSSAAM